MVLTVLYGRKYDKGQVQSEIGAVTFDTVLVEEHKYQSRITHYPVEYGTIISDHIVKEPDVVNISGMVSDTPLNIFAQSNRSVDAFNRLVEMQARRIVVNLVTGIKVYTNMAIASLNVPRNIKTGQTLTFNIEFQKVIFDDTIQIELNQGNVFAGVQDNTPRQVVAENTDIPFVNQDPAYSLKDQAQNAVNVGVQSLADVPISIQPQVLTSVTALAALV